MEIVKLIGSDVLPDDQKLVLEIARVIRLGFYSRTHFIKTIHVSQWKTVFDDGHKFYIFINRARTLVTMGHPMSVLKAEIFSTV